jgi:hypothetical protein
MSGFDHASFFGDRWAGVYEGTMPDAAPGRGVPRWLTGGGRVLELAIGTGRVGLPLAAPVAQRVARYADWDRRPSAADRPSHVSVYRKRAAPSAAGDLP